MDDLRKPMWSGPKSRQLIKRVVVEGRLTLETPAHFGSGDEAGSLVPLIFDEVSRQPLLTGASIAGALRSYLWTLEKGYGKKQEAKSLAATLFGGIRNPEKEEEQRDVENGAQSSLIIDDAYGENTQVELRDGVKIEGKSRTADDAALYTFMVWAAGATFNLRFELLVAKDQEEAQLRQALANALNGLQNNEITLGARKHRGFGRVTMAEWHIREFDLQKPDDLIAWVKEGGKALASTPEKITSDKDIFALLNTTSFEGDEDKRERFIVTAKFALESSVLIRADSTVAEMGHLYSNGKPVVSGTSLAGVIRARSLKIAQTLQLPDATNLIDEMFGAYGKNNGKEHDGEKREKRTASRVMIEEREIEEGETKKWVQSRVAIDRFTGGALDTALFDQQPQFGGVVQINLELRCPQKREIALLLLVLKDLWTGDLSVGGESSVGRGRLRGQAATLRLNDQEWVIMSEGKKLKIDGADRRLLENFVEELLPDKEATPA